MGRFLSVGEEVTQSDSLVPGQAFAQYFMACSPVLSCVSWTGVVFAVTFFFFSSQGVLKSTRLHIRRNLLRLVYSLAVCLFWRDCFESDWSLMRGCMGLLARRRRRGIVCVSVCTRTHLSSPLVKQNPWNAEECRFWTGARSYYKQVSSALCTLRKTHGLHSHIKENAGHARSLYYTHTHFLHLHRSGSFLRNVST